MVAVAYQSFNFSTRPYTYYTFICISNLPGTEAGPHRALQGRIIKPIWTHEKSIRFVTIRRGSVVVSEVEFALKNPQVEVESLPIADKIVDGESFLFLPSRSRLAFTLDDTIQVWDAKAAKLLLKSELPSSFTIYSISSFSSDGSFFAHLDINGVARVWKESPAGYVLHQTLSFVTPNSSLQLRLSPSGESIIMSPDGRAFHLWHTRAQIPSLPRVFAGNVDEKDFTLAFSPDERFTAFARQGENTVTVLNPLTGDLQLAVDTHLDVVCLGMTGSALIVVGEDEIVTWDLPGGDGPFNAGINGSPITHWNFSLGWFILRSVFTLTTSLIAITTLYYCQDAPACVSISPDFSRFVVLSGPIYDTFVGIYDMSTGRCLASTQADYAEWVGFTRDGCEVWTASEGWKIVEDSGPGPVRLEPRDGIVRPLGVFPWESRRGYQVTGDGWVLSATKKRLLWLPHRWRSYTSSRAWSGRFLGLLQSELSEIVILEFPE